MEKIGFNHGLSYPDNEGITLSDVAATLVAHERLLPIVVEILEKSLPGLHIERVDVQITDLHHGSLDEAFFFVLYTVYQKDLEKSVPHVFETLTGHQLDPQYTSLVTVLFMVALYTATKALLARLKGTSAEKAQVIDQSFNVYLNGAARMLDSTPERIAELAEQALGKKRRPAAIRAAIDLFRPAKRGGNGRVIPKNLTPVGPEAVSAFPDAVALAEMDDNTVPIPVSDGRLDVRALDKDRSDRGWYGRLSYDGHITKRLPVKLAPTVAPSDLANFPEASVDALLETQPQPDGDLKPVRIHVLAITDQRSPT